ncbi:hypothetical protein AB837_00539 [bacterium AB1]|nr:hypothetical protein AB837_00539 [bacterium AB1]
MQIETEGITIVELLPFIQLEKNINDLISKSKTIASNFENEDMLQQYEHSVNFLIDGEDISLQQYETYLQIVLEEESINKKDIEKKCKYIQGNINIVRYQLTQLKKITQTFDESEKSIKNDENKFCRASQTMSLLSNQLENLIICSEQTIQIQTKK